jgi:hypothetical protein
MFKNLKIQNQVENVLKNYVSIITSKEHIIDLYEEWHHPNIEEHKKIMWVVKDLKALLSELPKVDTYSFKLYNITYLFARHPEDGIDRLLDGLHDLMINFVDASGTYQANESFIDFFKSYKTLRCFLQELKEIEREAIIEIIKKENHCLN